MDIHEYQAKELLEQEGVKILAGGLADSPEQAVYQANVIGGSMWVVKAQIHSGARGKAGGVKVCHSTDEVRAAADSMLGKKLVTHQTGPAGKRVSHVYVEAGCEIEKELYFSLLLDRAHEEVVLVASSSGGMDIEELAEHSPEAMIKIHVEPAVGLQDFQARALAFALGIPKAGLSQAIKTIKGAYRTFRDFDAIMVEINPLVVTKTNKVIALDAKMAFDDNALFRHPDILALRDKSQEDPRETAASDRGLSYIGLEGDIGCMINGAGLAMATMDMIKHAGGEPANFLDIGGGASPERVAEAFRLVLADDNVKAMLVNIFAGINRCDWVAEGVVQAVRNMELKVPLVVRLAGTNVEEGQQIIENSGLSIITAETLADAASKAVAASRQYAG
ncbi:MAG: malate--CoA ligase subunit beta [Gammaproteobacteria bacterium]|nr:malate--CoA ligase subunit beta [Gammaproteobacteria bacterium]